MNEFEKIILGSLVSYLFASVPFLFYAVYRSRQIPSIWKRIDSLSKEKAEDNEMKGLDGRLRKVEIDFAEKMGRLSGIIEEFEKLEKRIEQTLDKWSKYGKTKN